MKATMKMMFAAAAVAATLSAAAAEEEESGEFDRWYVGASATLVLPQGGHSMRRLGGATARAGYYFTESLAVEADAAWLEDCAGLGVQGLWHIYGYERFDPFLTFGARGWIDGDVGPTAGIGAFYHLTDSWSIRADAQATLGLDGECEMVYSLGAGVQYSF
jgi:outer membrane protein W